MFGRRQRFAIWVLAVAGALTAPLWLILGDGGWAWRSVAAAALSLSSLTLMLVLLRSTPGDAIRLRVPASGAVLVAGNLWLHYAAGHFDGVISAVVLPLVALVVVALVAHRRRRRIWASALFLWHPLVLMIPSGSSPGAIMGWASIVVALAVTDLLVTRPDRVWHVWLWCVGAGLMMAWAGMR